MNIHILHKKLVEQCINYRLIIINCDKVLNKTLLLHLINMTVFILNIYVCLELLIEKKMLYI